MLDNLEEFNSLVHTVSEMAKADKLDVIVDLLLNAQVSIEQTDYDSWNGGTYCYTIYLVIYVKTFIAIKEQITEIENLLLNNFSLTTKHLENERISRISLIPRSQTVGMSAPNPHRPFSVLESKRREELTAYFNKATEDELIEEILPPPRFVAHETFRPSFCLISV